jgi:hypothetical protein
MDSYGMEISDDPSYKKKKKKLCSTQTDRKRDREREREILQAYLPHGLN